MGFLNYLQAQQTVFDKGVIYESINVKNTENETFAIYIPQSFNPSELSAIVFVFSPSGNGKSGIKPFVKAAEEYNYLLVSSNNSRNGIPYDTIFGFLDRLFDHIFSTFSIDPKQIYTAGFSGGSRLANTVAVLSKRIAGVIACGAGFSRFPGHVPTNEKYSYVGLVGDKDMNYLEMINNIEWFNKSGIENELMFFSGNHRWPPSDQIVRAFDWLELQAYKKGIRDQNINKVNAAYQKNYKEADSLKKDGLDYFSAIELERIVRNYDKILSLDSVRLKLKALKKSKAYKSQSKIQKSVKEEEEKTVQKFIDRIDASLKKEKVVFDSVWWKKELADYHKKYSDLDNVYLKNMKERIDYYLFAVAFERSTGYIVIEDYEKALYYDQMYAFLQPKRGFAYFRLARDYAFLEDKTNFILNLEKAIQLGFSNKERIRRTKAFEIYLEDETFKKLLDRY